MERTSQRTRQSRRAAVKDGGRAPRNAGKGVVNGPGLRRKTPLSLAVKTGGTEGKGREGRMQRVGSDQGTLCTETSSFVLPLRRQPINPWHFPTDQNVFVTFGEPLAPHLLAPVGLGHTRKTNRVDRELGLGAGITSTVSGGGGSWRRTTRATLRQPRLHSETPIKHRTRSSGELPGLPMLCANQHTSMLAEEYISEDSEASCLGPPQWLLPPPLAGSGSYTFATIKL